MYTRDMNNTDTSTKTELTYPDEHIANINRRSLINNGYQVSLIGYDTNRDVYAFDYWK